MAISVVLLSVFVFFSLLLLTSCSNAEICRSCCCMFLCWYCHKLSLPCCMDWNWWYGRADIAEEELYGLQAEHWWMTWLTWVLLLSPLQPDKCFSVTEMFCTDKQWHCTHMLQLLALLCILQLVVQHDKHSSSSYKAIIYVNHPIQI